MQVLPLKTGTSQRSGNTWRVQEYVLETYDRFPRKIVFNFFGDTIDQYPLQIGDDINLSFDLESRPFIGRDNVERWSTDVRGWKAEKIDPSQLAQIQAPTPGFGTPQYAAPAAQPAPVVGQFASQPAPAPEVQGNPTEDLPF